MERRRNEQEAAKQPQVISANREIIRVELYRLVVFLSKACDMGRIPLSDQHDYCDDLQIYLNFIGARNYGYLLHILI